MKVVNINKVLVIGIISLIIVNFSTFIYQKYTDKETNIPKVKLKDQEEKKDTFAIMLEQEDGTYQATESTSFNQPGYTFNAEKSGCIDINGNKIENALSYNETSKAVMVNTGGTAYCYIYFDKAPAGAEVLIDSGKLWESGLDGDGYRYTGTNPDNYICFGTKDKSTCTGNTDAYMYRIIGVFPDNEGKQHMKLIKKEALNTKMKWNDDYYADINWESSTLFNNLNGSTYFTNTTYMPTGWSDRITNWTWSAVNTLTEENSGPHYTRITTKQMYLHELNRSGKLSRGEWTTPEAKIGLMYASDYQMSLGALGYTGSNSSILKTGWMHLSNNDKGAPNGEEWTISRYGINSSGIGSDDPGCSAWLVSSSSDGAVGWEDTTCQVSVRPVFYLNFNQVIKSGSGTIDNPFILN